MMTISKHKICLNLLKEAAIIVGEFETKLGKTSEKKLLREFISNIFMKESYGPTVAIVENDIKEWLEYLFELIPIKVIVNKNCFFLNLKKREIL